MEPDSVALNEWATDFLAQFGVDIAKARMKSLRLEQPFDGPMRIVIVCGAPEVFNTLVIPPGMPVEFDVTEG